MFVSPAVATLSYFRISYTNIMYLEQIHPLFPHLLCPCLFLFPHLHFMGRCVCLVLGQRNGFTWFKDPVHSFSCRQVSQELKAEAQRHELNQRPWRDSAYLLFLPGFFSFLTLFFHFLLKKEILEKKQTSKVGFAFLHTDVPPSQKQCSSKVGWVFSQKSLIKKTPYK